MIEVGRKVRNISSGNGSVSVEEPPEPTIPESAREEVLETEVQQSFSTELLKLKIMKIG